MLWQLQIPDLLPTPSILWSQRNPDKMNIIFFAVLTYALDTGILVNKAGRDNTCGDGHHSNPKKGNKDAEYFTHCGDRIDISVAHRQQSGGCHQMPENALVNTSGWALFSRLYIHRLEEIISISMIKTDDINCCFLLTITSVITFNES